MNKRIVFFLLAALAPIAIIAFLFPDKVFFDSNGAPEDSNKDSDITVFVKKDCPHCKELKEFAEIQKWQPEYLEITDPENQRLFARLQERAPELTQGVPTTVINGEVIQGYKNHESTGAFLKLKLDSCRSSEQGCLKFREFLELQMHTKVISAEGVCTEGCEVDLDRFVFDLPLIGKVDLTLISLPALSALLGFLDGFNPCAMWVLITLLTLLIATNDMKKVWIVGGTFLFVSGAVYYLFIAAWLNAFLLIGFNLWIQKIIGVIAILGGGFYLYEAFGKNPNECSVTDLKGKNKTREKMKAIIGKTFWPAAVLGTAILAFSVNMIELVCTAGLPAVFTQILAFNDVSAPARYSYIGLYILLYMIDDIVIFTIAVYTLHATGLTKKYAKFTLIFGGALMYALGLLMIFAPEALTFA